MSNIVASEFLTLDGVMEAPEKWQFPYLTEDFMEHTKGQILAAGTMLMGRKTYQEFAPVWSTMVNNEFGFADKMNSTPKYVVSTTLDRADWNNSTLIKDDVLEEIRRLKEQAGGPIAVSGSATLVQSLMEAGLIDEYVLLVHPILIGSGKRLFKEGGVAPKLRLVDTRTFSSGIVVLTYQPEKGEVN